MGDRKERPEHYRCPRCGGMTSEPGHYNDAADGALLCTRWGRSQRPTVREAARRRMPLDGADAQALEEALAALERDFDRLAKAAEAFWATCREPERRALRAALDEVHDG